MKQETFTKQNYLEPGRIKMNTGIMRIRESTEAGLLHLGIFCYENFSQLTLS